MTALARAAVVARPAPGTTARARPAAGTAQRMPGRLGAGQALAMPVRRRLEQSLNADLASVRVHTDAAAQRAAAQAGARAFTYGEDIVLAKGERPDDLALLAHEVAHVIQQRGPARPQVQRLGDDGGALEAEASSASAAVVAGGGYTVSGRTSGNTVQRKPGLLDRGRALLGGAVDTVKQAAGDLAMELVNRYAPELAPFVQKGPQGVLDYLKERVTNGFKKVIDGVMAPVYAVAGAGKQLTARFAPMLQWVQEAAGKIAANDCTPLRQAAEKVEQLATKLLQPIVEKLQPVVKKIEDLCQSLWDKVGAPVWNWIKKVAKQQWDQIEQLASWVWDKCAPIRKASADAWTWVKNKLGIGDGPEGQNGILQWVQGKVEKLWDAVKEVLAPYQKEIKTVATVVGAVAVMASPAGPLVALGAAVVGVVQGVRWIKAHWGKGSMVVQARAYLQNTLIPTLQRGAHRFGSGLVNLARGLTGAIGRVAKAVGGWVGVAAGVGLSFIVSATQWVADQIDALAAWAGGKLMQVADGLLAMVDRLGAFLGRALNFLRRIANVVLDVWGIPILLAEKIWDMIPSCIRDPFVDFLIPIILRQIELFEALARDGEAWARTKTEIRALIKLVFKNRDLMGAVKASFRLVLRVFDVPPELLGELISKAFSVWDRVMRAPIDFVRNAVRATGAGFKRFGKNILSHLGFGIEGWLFGELAEKGISAPSSWKDPMAVFGFALDVLGLSVNHIFDLLKKRFDPKKVDKLRTWMRRFGSAIAWVRGAIDTSKSPAENTKGIIDKAKEFGSTVLQGVAEWVAGKVAEEIAIVATAAAASGGLSEIVDIARRVYKVFKAVKRYAQQIIRIAISALDSASEIASGAIDKAGARVEGLMRRAMPVVIGFLAEQVGLGGVGKKIRELVDTIRKKVDDAILWLIDKVKAGIDAILRGIKAVAGAIADWWKTRVGFRSKSGESHTISTEGTEDAPAIYVESKKTAIDEAIGQIADGGLKSQAKDLKRDVYKAIRDGKNAKDDAEADKHAKTVQKHLNALGGVFRQAGVPTDDSDPALELGDGIPTSVSYGGVDAQRGGKSMTADPLTPEHGAGSSPSVVPPIWAAVNQRRNGKRLYVMGHLLNNKLGGPGDNIANLTPITFSCNAAHQAAVESTLKSMINTARKFVYYKVSVKYPRSPVATPPEAAPEEGFLATAISWEWQQLKRKKTGGGYERMGSPQRGSVPNFPNGFPQT
ncbi:DUF4157 domain-containing protein [Niveibacterium sp. COAC-50]|uniref:eCIS core domain-containing protein n=1 Tax=Niveibacterium sp. COAC-50 TaxID=2729384 RepID=UPI0015554929